MIMKRIVNIIVLLNFIGLIVLGTYVLVPSPPRKFFIETAKVFSEYTMTKEYQKKMDEVKTARQHILDSLKFKVRDLSLVKTTKAEQLEIAKKEFLYKQEEFRRENEALEQKYNQEVWAQLNQYVKDYGKEKNCEFIFGAVGDGGLMYAEEGLNITDELIEFVNNKYQGK
jgi:outer membrane protein